MRFGGRTPHRVHRRGSTESPGTLLGERTGTCARCGRDLPMSRLTWDALARTPGATRVLVCADCRTPRMKRLAGED